MIPWREFISLSDAAARGRGHRVRRRDFITLLGGAAAFPIAARGQQRERMPVLGYLGAGAPEMGANFVAGLRRGLRESGFEEGRNLAIEYRWAHNQIDRFPALAADLVQHRVDVLAAMFNTSGALALKAATSTIPIVFCTGNDPVETGLVASINRPGGNITGMYYLSAALAEKRLGILRELIPGVDRVAMLLNPENPSAESVTKDVQKAASAIGQRVDMFHAKNNSEIDTAFSALVQMQARALMVSPDPLFTNRRVQLVSLAARHTMPAIYTSREYVEVGGLMTYGTNLADVARQAGNYVSRILKGEKPADLPVVQPTKFEFVISLQTAKLIGLVIPTTLLAQADEVIE